MTGEMRAAKYRIVVESVLHEEEIIGAKEQIAALLEGIGSTKVVEIRKVEAEIERLEAEKRRRGETNKFEMALDRIKKNVEFQDGWTEEDLEHYKTIIRALEIVSDLYKVNIRPTEKGGEG